MFRVTFVCPAQTASDPRGPRPRGLPTIYIRLTRGTVVAAVTALVLYLGIYACAARLRVSLSIRYTGVPVLYRGGRRRCCVHPFYIIIYVVIIIVHRRLHIYNSPRRPAEKPRSRSSRYYIAIRYSIYYCYLLWAAFGFGLVVLCAANPPHAPPPPGVVYIIISNAD